MAWKLTALHLDPGCIPCFCHAKINLTSLFPCQLCSNHFFVYKFTPIWNHAKLLKKRKATIVACITSWRDRLATGQLERFLVSEDILTLTVIRDNLMPGHLGARSSKMLFTLFIIFSLQFRNFCLFPKALQLIFYCMFFILMSN